KKSLLHSCTHFSRHGSFHFCSRGRTFAGYLALIEKGNYEQNQAKDKKGNNAVETLEIRAVVDEHLDDHQAEERESLPAKKRGLALDAEPNQCRSVSRPQERQRKMLSEARVDPQGGLAAEIIPQLEREREKREEVGSYSKKAKQTALFGGNG